MLIVFSKCCVCFSSFDIVCYEFDNGVWDVCVVVGPRGHISSKRRGANRVYPHCHSEMGASLLETVVLSGFGEK